MVSLNTIAQKKLVDSYEYMVANVALFVNHLNANGKLAISFVRINAQKLMP